MDVAQKYRLSEIVKWRRALLDEIEKRELLYKKYSKAIDMMEILDVGFVAGYMAFGVVDIALLASVIGTPIVLGLNALGVCCGVGGVTAKFLRKKFLLKAKKHDEIRVAANATLANVVEKTSKSFTDHNISEEDFSAILSEYKTFWKTRESIREQYAKIGRPHLNVRTLIRQSRNASSDRL